MPKTIAEINEKIRKGEALVVNAEEIIDIVEEDGVEKAAENVDVVTTGTFGPMCSSGRYDKYSPCLAAAQTLWQSRET